MIFALEGLRGVAALAVALFHGWGSVATVWFQHGWIAVDLFFVTSGFVMALTYRDMDDWDTVRSFALKRIGRLYPLHLFTLAAFIASEQALQAIKLLTSTGITQPHFDLVRPWSLLANIFLVHGIGLQGERTYNGPSWSISTEMWAYALFALTCVLVRRRDWVWFFLALGSLAAWLMWPGVAGDLFRCLWAFFLGALLPHLQTGMKPSDLEINAAQVISLAAVALMGWGVDTPGMQYILPVPFAALVLSLSFDRGCVASMLRRNWPRRLGEWSYSIYMTHWVLLVFFNPLGGRLVEPFTSLLKVAYVAAVLLVSAICYERIEKPWRERFRTIARARPARVTVSIE